MISVLYLFCVILAVGIVWGQEVGGCQGGDQWGLPCTQDANPESGCFPRQKFVNAHIMGTGARVVDNEEYPYIVSLQTLKCGNHALNYACYNHFCGGTMIAKNLILTAAHCFDKLRDRNPDIDMYGQYSYRPSQSIYVAPSPKCRHLQNEKYGRFEVNSIFIHLGYQHGVVPANDVAIVDIYRKKGKFYDGPLVEIVKEDETQEMLNNAWVLGYGEVYLADVGKYVVRLLRGAFLGQIDESFYSNLLNSQGSFSDGYLNYTNMVCYWNMTTDSCNGDSGGPLLLRNKEGIQDIQIGLVSWGRSCQKVQARQSPGVYARLTLFANWIEQIKQQYGQGVYQEVEAPSPTPSPSPMPSPSPTPVPTVPQSPIDCSAANNMQCDIDALLAFKDSFTAGEDLLQSWSGLNLCNWKYIVCAKLDGKNQRVSELRMIFKGTPGARKIYGSIVPDFSKMRYLQIFQINSQNLKGNLHKEFSVLVDMRQIVLENLQISGTLPPEYSTWNSLQYFQVPGNQISGSIPKFYSSLENLKHFHVTDNKLSGSLPETFSKIIKLENFRVFKNQITGPLPAEYLNLLNIKAFSIGENLITGNLPVEFSTWKRLKYMYMSDNQLTGTLPPQYSNFEFIEKIFWQQNRLSGTLPPQFSVFRYMIEFQIWNNDLSGTLPVQYSYLRSIQIIDLSYNIGITGTLPKQYSNMRKIQQFYALYTDLLSEIPDEWSVITDTADINV